jgi:Questin oxidase-like
MTDGALLDALDRLRGTGPEFGGFLANHGPMASEALVRLGAAERVGGWVDGYLPRLDGAPAAGTGIDDWRERLGDEHRFGDWTAYLRREAADRPWRELLLRWWPRLLPGLAASATHGVIRTAHAVRSLRTAGDGPDPLLVDELAQGLAFWAARYQPLPGAPRLAGSLPAVPAVAALPRLDPDAPAAGPGLIGRMNAVATLADYPAGLDGWGPPADADAALDELVGAAARVLAARADAPIAFCHAVTAPAAVRLVLPELPAPLRMASVAASWQSVGAIVAGFAAPRLPGEAEPAGDAPDPVELTGRAVEHGDEHVIKLTEAALREHARTGDATLLVAADRFRDRVERP